MMNEQGPYRYQMNGDDLEVVVWHSQVEVAQQQAEERYEYFFKHLHPELEVHWKRAMQLCQREDEGLSGYLIRARVHRSKKVEEQSTRTKQPNICITIIKREDGTTTITEDLGIALREERLQHATIHSVMMGEAQWQNILHGLIGAIKAYE